MREKKGLDRTAAQPTREPRLTFTSALTMG